MANSNGVQYGFGQYGSIHVRGTNAVTCGLGNRVFVAIQFLEDTKFAASAAGLVPESSQLFPASAASGTAATSTDIDADGGIATGTEIFPKGITIYGRWSAFQLATGGCIAYIGA
tara:strand:- start:885 stop:1229 length:345 start_codon:yes stop_codon:yes gene_type:complete